MIKWIRQSLNNYTYYDFRFYYIVWLIVSFVFCLIFCFIDLEIVQTTWWILLLAPLLFFVVFAPTIILSYVFFQLVKKPYIRVCFISALIPSNNLLYMIIFNNSGFSYIVGFLMLFLILPLLLLTIMLIPKKRLIIKEHCILTIIITEIIGLLLVYFILAGIPAIQTKIELNNHNQTINYLYEYKLKNGKYPTDLSNMGKVKYNHYKYVEYKTINNGNEYIYAVKEDNNIYTPTYIYTSDQQYKNKLLKNEQRKLN